MTTDTTPARSAPAERGRYDRLRAATAGLEPPFGVIDLDAFDANAVDLERRAGGKPIRLASKSLRSRALIRRALARPGSRASSASRCPKPCGWPRSSRTSSSATRPPTPPRCAGWPPTNGSPPGSP